MSISDRQQNIMWTLSHFYYEGGPVSDNELYELFNALINELELDDNNELRDWCLLCVDLHAIKYYDDEDFTEYLNYMYSVSDSKKELKS